jgi:carbon-monoxide dehydrogenase small subunit
VTETTHQVRLTVNGIPREVSVPARRLLADCLRHDLRLTGTHVGCEHGVCGACTVQVDDEPVRSCLMFAVQADGRSVRTVEALEGDDGALHPLQVAFHEAHALQCGFCTPGFLMSLEPFVRDRPDASEAEIREALAGNLCRCTGYEGIVEAVRKAAAAR